MLTSRDVDLRNAHLNNVGGNQTNISHNYVTEDNFLAVLKPVSRSGYDIPRCMEGTRGSIFREIDSWLNELDTDTTPNMLWITGSPGAGKSAIASTLVSVLTKLRRLGSFFFFKRGDANLGDPTALWRTVAYELAQFHPSIKASIAEFLSGPGFRDSDILLHFECLIEDVLKKNWGPLSGACPVIVIDALDECGSDDSRSTQRQIILDTLARWPCLPRSFKLVVTSRDERVPSTFNDPRVCRKIELNTGDSVSIETQNDIRTFFERSFHNIRPSLGLSTTWPGDHAIGQLTDRAAGLFVWAKTAMAFMEEKWKDPKTKLKLVLAGHLDKQSENIDTLYRHILDFWFKDASDVILELFKMIIGAIIVAKVPFHRDYLKQFLGRRDDTHEWQFAAILNSLSSVIEVDGFLCLRHLSFAEFLCDPNRCREHRFFIDQNQQHQNMALACLRVMKEELRFNICSLESSHLRNHDVPDLSLRIAKSISAPLQYSCCFWAAHLCSTPRDENQAGTLLDEVRQFFHVRLLYWLEVMSLVREVPTSSIALLMAARWIESLDIELSDFARDASRFIANFHIPISESAPHIYLSALPFSPRRSLVSRQFLSQFPETLSVAMGRDDHWPPLVNLLLGHTDHLRSVACSPDGKLVASGSVDKTVCVWDIETGEIVAGPFEHASPVRSVAYSPDRRRVVSGSADGTICEWDLETSQLASFPFHGHLGGIWSVAYSPSGKQVVSGSDDMMIFIWDVDTGRIVKGFGGHTNSVRSVVFSPDGRRIASGSDDETVCVWDVESGYVVAGPFTGHTSPVQCVAYSPDGKRIVSGSVDETLRIWDIETGHAVGGPFRGHTNWIHSVAYLPRGLRVVSGSEDNTIRVWDVETGQMVAGPLKGHANGVFSVACSPDGKRIVSGSDDQTIRVWDVEAANVAASPFKSHTHWVRSVAYSPDGRRVVSGSRDGTVCVWDVQTCQIVAGPLKGHTDGVLSVTFSPDGRRVASGSKDKMICVWNVKTERIVTSPFRGHTNGVLSVAYSPDGKRVVSGSEDKTVCVWDVKSGQIVAGPFRSHKHAVWSVAYSPDGKRVVSGSDDKTICIWDVETGYTIGPIKGHTHWVRSVAYSPDGYWVVSGSKDGTVCLWDVETGRRSAGPFQGPTDGVTSVAFSPDGCWVVSGSYDETVCVWDVKTGQIIAGPFKGHSSWVHSLAFSPDGKQVLSGSFHETLVWNIENDYTIPIVDKRDHTTLQPIWIPNVFSSCRHEHSNGWTYDSTSTSQKSAIFFWVPVQARRGLCDAKTLFVLCARRMQLDLSRFVHGTNWTRCHPHPCEDVPRSATPDFSETESLRSFGHIPSEFSGSTSSLVMADRLTSPAPSLRSQPLLSDNLIDRMRRWLLKAKEKASISSQNYAPPTQRRRVLN